MSTSGCQTRPTQTGSLRRQGVCAEKWLMDGRGEGKGDVRRSVCTMLLYQDREQGLNAQCEELTSLSWDTGQGRDWTGRCREQKGGKVQRQAALTQAMQLSWSMLGRRCSFLIPANTTKHPERRVCWDGVKDSVCAGRFEGS